MILRSHMIERAFEGGLESYEFCGHADPWKLEWTGHTRDVDIIDAFSPDLSGTVRRLAARAGRHLRRHRQRD